MHDPLNLPKNSPALRALALAGLMAVWLSLLFTGACDNRREPLPQRPAPLEQPTVFSRRSLEGIWHGFAFQAGSQNYQGEISFGGGGAVNNLWLDDASISEVVGVLGVNRKGVVNGVITISFTDLKTGRTGWASLDVNGRLIDSNNLILYLGRAKLTLARRQ